MPSEIVASVGELPVSERPTMHGWVYRDKELNWRISMIEPKQIANRRPFTIPASNAPPPVSRMSEQECRERAHEYFMHGRGDVSMGSVVDLVAFARSLKILEGT